MRPRLVCSLFGFGVLCAALLFPHRGVALTVSLAEFDPGSGPLSTHLEATANNELCCGGNVQAFDPVSLPFTDQHRADSGGVVSDTAYSLGDAGFTIDIVEHYRMQRSSAISSGAIYFTVDQDAEYALSGVYAMVGSRDIYLSASLTNISGGSLLFDNLQESRATQDEAFQLGEQSGDSQNGLSGSLTGQLVAGSLYRLNYRAFIYSTEASDGDATATGSIAFAVVPEPSTGLLMGLALAGLVYRRRIMLR